MRIVLLGYGKMGHQIEQIALQRGHSILFTIDKDTDLNAVAPLWKEADVAIEFSTPDTAVQNIRLAWQQDLPVVCGTTAWTDILLPNGQTQLQALQIEANTQQHGLFWTSNFSVGVNLFFALNKYLAELMKPYNEYAVRLTETHHIHKLDAPSGTARSLQQDIQTLSAQPQIPIESIREGEVPGIHEVIWESNADLITIRHEAKSRQGFALGAVLAAEYMQGKTGFHDMHNLIKL